MTTATQPLVDKVSQGVDLNKDDLNTLQTLIDLNEAKEPGAGDEVVHKGDESVPAPIVRKVSSAGYVWLRRNSDGKLREVNKNILPTYIKMKLPDGRPAWLAPNAPWNGRVRTPDTWCRLSIHHPDRARMDALNLEVCLKRGKLMGATGARRHEMKKHRDSWEAIQRDEEKRRQDARDKRDITMTEALTTALSGKKPAVAEATAPSMVELECDVCSETFESTHKTAATNKLNAHKRKAHKEA